MRMDGELAVPSGEDAPRSDFGAGYAAETPDCDRLARVYRWMEWASFGPFLWLCRCAFLSEMRGRRRALAIGEGDGRFLARLLNENRKVQVDAVDASPEMLGALERRAGSELTRVRTTCADVREWRADEAGYDLVVTHFFLDFLTTQEAGSLAERVRAAMMPGAIWVVSEFAIPDGWFGRLAARPVVGFLYWAFGWMTGLKVRQLPEYGAALQAAGFALARRKIWLGGLLVSELWVAQRASDGEELAVSTRPLNVQEARVTAWSAIEKNTSIN